MAYAALVSTAQTINQILNHGHTLLPPDIQEIITSILDHVVDLKSFLGDLPLIVNSLELEGQIREVATTVEDVIESLLSAKNPSDCRSIKPTVGVSDSDFELQLQQVAEKLKSFVVGYVKHLLPETEPSRGHDSGSGSVQLRTCVSSRRAATSKVMVLSSHEDLFWVMKQLTFGCSSSRLQVLSIVGTGGIGKTTFAEIVYNSPPIMKYFDIRGWVTVSQDYSVGSVALHLLAFVKGISNLQSKIPKEDEIREYLMGGRYLIVMDNVRSKKAWDDVRKLFPDNDNGSRIMLTTRLQDVATYADPSSPSHMVRLLSADHSWCLLRNKVFGDQLCPSELEQVGMEIATQCGGLPLSIVVVAGLLSKIDKTYRVWKQIAESDGQLETMISLSYIHLPHHLKACFLYMGGFPEDYEVCVSDVIKLWVAEGFMRYKDGSKRLEEEAEDCLEDLVERRLVLVTSKNFDGKIKRCSLHDVVRDFCIRQGRHEKLILPVVDYLPCPFLRRHFLPLVMKNHKRISATSYDLDLKDSMHGSRAHSIICIPQKGCSRLACVKSFSLLRVLHVLRRNDYGDWEPYQVFDLIYLTYLASNIPTSIVPPAISNLQNLQTLIIYRFEVRLPVEIWRMRQLRHLIAFSFHHFPHPEEPTFPLENLQTLSLATNFVCSERMVEMIPNIQKLGICYSEEVFGEGYHLGNLTRMLFTVFGEGYHLGNLTRMLRLEKLRLETHGSFWMNPVFPVSLKKLTLSGWRLPWRDMKIVGSLPNLQVLKLRNNACDGERWETTYGEFVNLRLLLIDESNLQYWKARTSHFPRLKCLMLHRCLYLMEIPITFRTMRTLELIEVDDHNQSLFDSAKKIQARWDGNVQVRVKHF